MLRLFALFFVSIVVLFIIYHNISENDFLKPIAINSKQKLNEISDVLFHRNVKTDNHSCSQLLSRNINLPMNKTMQIRLEDICLQKSRKESSSIFDKTLIENNLENISCPNVNPKYANKSGPYVALASFPGSGNSWTRVLLETITGVYTGSIYADPMASFPGSKKSPCKAGVFIVKTHKASNILARTGCPKDLPFSKAILIMRDPYDAIIAEYNRKNGGKVAFANPTAYDRKQWHQRVEGMIRQWENMVLFWLTKFRGPLYVLFYERLKQNTMFEMYKVMRFLNLNVTLKQLYCLVNDSHDIYYRGKRPDWLNKTKLFSNEAKLLINSKINNVQSSVRNKYSNEVSNMLKTYVLSYA